MEMIKDLRQKHLSGWTKALRELKPAEIESVRQLPDVEFEGISVQAAIKAGWFVDVSKPEIVDDMKSGEVSALSKAVWQAYKDARQIDPN